MQSVSGGKIAERGIKWDCEGKREGWLMMLRVTAERYFFSSMARESQMTHPRLEGECEESVPRGGGFIRSRFVQ